MTKKNLKPQQAAPVQREVNTTSSEAGGTGTGLSPQVYNIFNGLVGTPFASDDAE